MLLAQLADKGLGVVTKSIVGEFTESIWLVSGIGGPGVRRKQHGGAQAVFIAPLDGLHNKFLVAGTASAGQKEVGRNVEGDGFAIKRLTALERVVGVGSKDMIS